MSNIEKKVLISLERGEQGRDAARENQQLKANHFISASGGGRVGNGMEKYSGSVYTAGVSTYQS